MRGESSWDGGLQRWWHSRSGGGSAYDGVYIDS